MNRVAVIGGGLAGLTAAHTLARGDVAVTLVESTNRLGGQILTEHADDFVVELGAEGFPSGSRVVPDLCHELGTAEQLMSQSATQSLALKEGRLEPLPRGRAASILGFQVAEGEIGRGLRTLRGGMTTMINALHARLGSRVELRIDSRVSRIVPKVSGWSLEIEGGDSMAADALVIAIPPAPGGHLLAPLVPDAGRELARTKTVSSVTVSVAFRREDVRDPLDGTGFVVPGGGDDFVGLRACSFSSSKFRDRAPRGWVLLRVYFRPDEESLKQWTDDQWVGRTMDLLPSILGTPAEATRSWVSRWENAIPRYGDHHEHLVRDLSTRLTKLGHVALAGGAFDGVGVDPAVKSGRAAGDRLRAELGLNETAKLGQPASDEGSGSR